jgi:diguanylate cyclase (GGDEF)-like protein
LREELRTTAAGTALESERSDPAALATALGADDILVFRGDDDVLRLVGGVGRGAGWAEIVEIRSSEESHVNRAWRAGIPCRIASSQPTRIVGPYWAAHAILVPVGDDYVVVFGASKPLPASDAIIVNAAAMVVAGTHGVPADKLLADELELVHAVRALMAYRPQSVVETARHIALVAARALSCELAAIHVRHGEDGELQVVRIDEEQLAAGALAGHDAASYLQAAALLPGPAVEQVVGPHPRVWADDVVARMTLPLGTSERIGALALGHATQRPRGFTQLCQRIGRALAESAELLLAEAITRERLAAEHDLLRRASLTDPLTGVGSRVAWDEAIGPIRRAEIDQPSFAVLSVDLDRLKTINDRFGHSVGDAVIRGAANLLSSAVREGDTLARVGGDEFLVLLPDTGEDGARKIVRRISNALRAWRVTEHGLAPELSVGWAVSEDDPETVIERADRRMYLAKRRRSRQASQTGSAIGEAVPERRAGQRRGDGQP